MKLAIFQAVTVAITAAATLVSGQDASLRPSQHHLAYHGSFGMTVSWSTHAKLQRPTVHFGLTPYTLFLQSSSDVSVTYNTSSVYLNHVVLKDLLPDTTYWYSVSNSFPNQTYSFKTARLAGDPRPYTAAMVVDMGTFGDDGLSTHLPASVGNALQPGEVTTIQRLSQDLNKFDLLLHPGDLAYADYWLKEEVLGYLPMDLSTGPQVYERINEEFFDELQNITAVRPYMVAPGNHEANCDNGGYKKFTESLCVEGQRNFTGYTNRFRMPSDVSGGVGNFWYSFDYGMTHYLFFDTETDLGDGLIGPDEKGGGSDSEGPFGPTMNAQIDFIKKDLASVNRLLTPWVVAAGHRPWYMAAAPSSLCTTCQEAFEPLFNEYGVDLVVHGHIHAMNRNNPIANNVSDPAGLNNPKAPWYIVNGAAGHFDGLDSLISPLPSYVAFANNTLYSYSRLTFHNRTHRKYDEEHIPEASPLTYSHASPL